MNNAILERVNRFADEMQLHYASPNRNIIADVMTLDAADLNQLNKNQLSQYVVALGQYLVMLQYNENMAAVQYTLTNKAFEHKINMAQLSNQNIVGKTEKVKRSWLVENDPEVNELYYTVMAYEAEKMVITNMVKAVEGLLNALKKELASHYNG
jgi:hypothetical protein